MRKSPFMKEVLGEEVYKKYINAKEQEWMEYTSQVTDWEIKDIWTAFSVGGKVGRNYSSVPQN